MATKFRARAARGTTQSDLLVINKTDLAEMVGADLGVMDRDAKKMRGEGPTVFACIKDREGLEGDCRAHSYGAGEGYRFLLMAWAAAFFTFLAGAMA